MVSLGTSYGQRLRRVGEVALGVALGVFGADLLVSVIGSGRLADHPDRGGLAMTAAILLDSGQVFVIQAAVQSIVVTTLLHGPAGGGVRAGPTRLIGGAVALVAATVVPAAPLRRPREEAAKVLRKVRDLLLAFERVMVDRRRRPGDGAPGRGPGDRQHGP